jgi:cell division protein FtsW (lipid II flippase)/cell division protein FtsI/penicillin-binding protein 2
MRVIPPPSERTSPARPARGITRCGRIELLGLLACSAVVGFGLLLTYSARTSRLMEPEGSTSAALNLRHLRGPDDLVPLLTMFEDSRERLVVAQAVYDRAAAESPRLEHVGGLASARVAAADIQRDPRLLTLRARLAQRPGAASVPALAPADIVALKPHLVVRTRGQFAAAIQTAAAWFFAAFWIAHLVRLWRRADDDPLLLPVLLLLSGLGFIAMLALRDPLRDTVTASAFVSGVVMGLAALLAVSAAELEASRLRRAVIAPLGVALGLAALLLVFGKGPGSSGVKVNLLGFQPVEGIRLLVMLSLAAYFAQRIDFLRELAEPSTARRPWLRYVRLPRWKDVRPLFVSMAMLLGFFFLQKDLGPALVLSCMFLALYGIGRGRSAFVVAGFALLVAGFAAAYAIGFPATVRQRVAIWVDPWNNGIAGGNQIAQGLWAFSTGSVLGAGPGLGEPQVIPAASTDFVLAAIGEELGFVGVASVFALYALLCWRCLRVATRAPGDYTAFLAAAAALALVVQALVIASGLMGLVPLSGVVTPFLSYGRSSMMANCVAVGIVLGIAKRRGEVRGRLQRPIAAVAGVLTIAAAAVAARAAWIQIVTADDIASRPSLSEQADGGVRFEHNPRLLSAARMIVRGTIYDRNGLPLATSRPEEIRTLEAAYRQAGIVPPHSCTADTARCYPLGGILFHVIGDWNHQTNWGAPNSSYLERDRDAVLKGYDDRPEVVQVVNAATGAPQRTVRREYRDLLPLVRNRYRMNNRAVQALLERKRDLYSSIDARLQVRTAAALRDRIEGGGLAHGAAVVLDVDSGEVLASVSYPWPEPDDPRRLTDQTDGDDVEARERLLDRVRYGLYPPGSTFKVLVAGAALRASPTNQTATAACIRLPDGRVGNYVRGVPRPVRDDPMDTVPHGKVDLRHALVVSCNAYFAQLAIALGPRPLLDAAAMFQIDLARTATAAGLQPSLAQAGYGQGQVIVSPLKMARVISAVAAHGVVPTVSWIRSTATETPDRERFLSRADAAVLSQYLREAVTAGTGRMLASNATAIAGKTGTAEVQSGRAHSWFAGFAPFGSARHRIAFSVLVEHAGYGARTAAPIAGEIVAAARGIGWFKGPQTDQ